jgi:hypothetical protein
MTGPTEPTEGQSNESVKLVQCSLPSKSFQSISTPTTISSPEPTPTYAVRQPPRLIL